MYTTLIINGCDVVMRTVVISTSGGDSNCRTSQLLEESIAVTLRGGWAGMKEELIIWPCSLFRIKKLLLRILMALRLIPLWIRVHLSLRRSDSVCLSSCDISGLILIALGSD